MFQLLCDVIAHRFDLRKANREDAEPFCHAKSAKSGLFVLSHSDELRFASFTISAASHVRDSAHKR